MSADAYRIAIDARYLAKEARKSGLQFIGYILDMAADEAEQEGRKRERPAETAPEHLSAE